MKACVVCNSKDQADVPGGSQEAARSLFGEDALLALRVPPRS
jgi:hypothetical protein